MTTVGIINVTGYAGLELARILLRHPAVRLVSVTGRSQAGQRLDHVFPFLDTDLVIADALEPVDLAFSAMPHKASAEVVAPLVQAGVPVIDLSADFRLRDVAVYEEWYQVAHPAPGLLPRAVYGLPELHRDAIRNADVVASPGCYPTAAILAMAPAVRHGLVGPGGIIVDAKSGVSGAGRGLALNVHYSEINENLHAYALGGHRHHPEISGELSHLRGQDLPVTFVPHLVPMTRGILATCYATLAPGVTAAQVQEAYATDYGAEPFVRITGQAPETKWTAGTNLAMVQPVVDQRTGRLIAMGAIDNLVKGAAGQAVQAMNLRLGLDETTGLTALALYP